MEEKEVTYSFSKLSCFETCKRQYFYNYILKTEQKDNIYTLLGSSIHDLVESLQQGEVTREVAIEKLETDFELFDILGFKFPSEKTKENYQKSITHFFRNFEPVHNSEFEIEKEVGFDLEGRKFVGYVDLLLHDSNGGVTIVDYKTSSKYTGDKLIHASRQLILYGIALEHMGYKVNGCKFNMLKYASVAGKNGRTKTEQRCDLTDEPNEPLYVSVPYNDYTKQEAVEWALDLIKQIESYTIFDTYESTFNSFYCNTLCSFCDSCDECKNNKSKFFGSR